MPASTSQVATSVRGKRSREPEAGDADQPLDFDDAIEVDNPTQVQTSEPTFQEKLSSFVVRRVIRENHNDPIIAVVPHPKPILTKMDDSASSSVDCSNVVATVSKGCVTIYDNENGTDQDHLDLMLQYYAQKDEHGRVKSFTSACWIAEDEDAQLALGAEDGIVRILSVCSVAELYQLKGKGGAITEVVAHPERPDAIIVTASPHDSEMCLWSLLERRVLITVPEAIHCMAFNTRGTMLVGATIDGKLRGYSLPSIDDILSSDSKKELTASVNFNTQSRNARLSRYECVRFADNDTLLVAQDGAGRVELFDLSTGEMVRSFMPTGGSNMPARARFDISPDGQCAVFGCNSGGVSVYNLGTGKLLAEMKHRRASKPTHTAAFMKGGMNIIFGSEEGLLWRFDYVTSTA